MIKDTDKHPVRKGKIGTARMWKGHEPHLRVLTNLEAL